MKTLTEYSDDLEFEQFINEGLLSKLFGFFKKILKKTNKDKLEIKDASKNLKKSKPLNMDALDNDAFMQIVSDKNIGFAVLNKMIKNKNKFFVYNENPKTEYNPEFNTFFYKDGKHINYVGILGIDKKINIIDGYLTVFIVDTAVNVTNHSEVVNFMINDLMNNTVQSNYKGCVIKPNDTTLTTMIKKVGFKSMDKNREIYIMDL